MAKKHCDLKNLGNKNMTESKNITNSQENPETLEMLGIGLLKISETNSDEKFEVIFQKGIGMPLIQNTMEMYIKEILDRKQGNSIIPVQDYTIFMYYFQNGENIIIILFMNDKEDSLSYPQLYLETKSIRNSFRLNTPISKIKRAINERITIPIVDGIAALFIIGASGSPYISKVKKNRTAIADREVVIGGFISALFSFSREVIGIESGAELKEINFGNQTFYVIAKKNVIFAYLAEKVNLILRRYMHLIVDEFLAKYQDCLINFDGDVMRFYEFENTIDQYFRI